MGPRFESWRGDKEIDHLHEYFVSGFFIGTNESTNISGDIASFLWVIIPYNFVFSLELQYDVNIIELIH